MCRLIRYSLLRARSERKLACCHPFGLKRRAGNGHGHRGGLKDGVKEIDSVSGGITVILQGVDAKKLYARAASAEQINALIRRDRRIEQGPVNRTGEGV